MCEQVQRLLYFGVVIDFFFIHSTHSHFTPPTSQHLVCERHFNTSFELIKSLLHRSHPSFAPGFRSIRYNKRCKMQSLSPQAFQQMADATSTLGEQQQRATGNGLSTTLRSGQDLI